MFTLAPSSLTQKTNHDVVEEAVEASGVEVAEGEEEVGDLTVLSHGGRRSKAMQMQ